MEKKIQELEKRVQELENIIKNSEFLKDTFADKIIFKKKVQFLNVVTDDGNTTVIN